MTSASETAAIDNRSATETRNGMLAAFVAYGAWGFLPILFHYVSHLSPVFVVAERVVWSLLLITAIIWFRKGFGQVMEVLRDRRALAVMAVSAVLLAANWLIYVWAVESGQVLEASFGYFINPLVNIAIGMLLLGERQNRWQTVSIAVAVVAIVIQAIGIGRVPYVALGLALTFGFYGYFRKTAKASSTTGLFVETLIIFPFALAYIAYDWFAHGAGPHADPGMLLLLILTGPATALPLLLFAYAVQRLRLTTIGMFQYLAPTLAFILAITFFQEELNPVRLVSFVLIGVSLAIFSYDGFRRRGQGK